MDTRKTIALDVRKLLRPKTGIGNYISELIDHLIALNSGFKYLLLGDRPVRPGEIPSNCEYVALGRFYREDGKLAQLYSPLWLNVLVSRYLNQRKVALFHGPNFVVPVNADCPCVNTVHDLAFLKVPQAYTQIYRRYMIFQVQNAVRHSALVIANSEATKNDLISLMQVPKDKIVVIHHGVNSKFQPRRDFEFLKGIRTRFNLPLRFLLSVGVIEHRKNLETLFRAAKTLIAEGLTDGVVLAGKKGLGAEKIRQYAINLDIGDRVHWLGYVADDLLVGLYNLAQCLVYPSWYEGFGMPILEAMACGCPVVASDVSSIPEAAGNAALLFPPSDSNLLEIKLRQLLTSEQLRSEMIIRGRTWVSQFTWEKTAEKHLAVYQKVLEDFCLKEGTCSI